jgi:hypothetical protein
MPLEDFYAGDDGFHQFAVACESEWAKCLHQPRLLSAVEGDLDIAMACHYKLGENVFDWLDSAVLALDGLTPSQCLKSEKGTRRLKECLWRMPYDREPKVAADEQGEKGTFRLFQTIFLDALPHYTSASFPMIRTDFGAYDPATKRAPLRLVPEGVTFRDWLACLGRRQGCRVQGALPDD